MSNILLNRKEEMHFKIKLFLILFFISSFTVESRIQNILRSRSNPKITKRHLELYKNAGVSNSEGSGTRVTKTCLNDEVFMITGPVLKLTDIPLKKDIKCNTENDSETKIVELFATEKVIIDGNLIETGEELTFVIIAPTWEVIGSREIILDGANGRRHYPPKAERGIGENQTIYGKSGLPGGNGGNFYGIGKTFINSESLLISANGGNGGSGQDGGDGADGVDGTTYSVDEGLDGLEKPWFTVQRRLANYDPPGTKTVHFTVDGKNGTSGQNGGNGGSAGKAGKKGIIKIISLDGFEEPSFLVSALDGSEGLPGEGGRGGKGGLNGRTVKFTVQSIQSWPFFSSVEELSRGSAPDGEDGKAGESRLGFRFQHKEKTDFDLVEAVNDFKFYATWYLSNNNSGEFLGFFNLLREDETIKKSYRTSGYMQEFYYLEVLCFHLKKKAELVPLYRSLKERLEDYSKHREGEEQILEYEKILEDLGFYLSRRILELTADAVQLYQNKFYGSLEGELRTLHSELIRDIYPDVESTKLTRDSRRMLNVAYESFSKTMNLISREHQEKFDIMKGNLDERIIRLVSNRNKPESQELNNLIIERFSLECFYLTNLELEFVGFAVSLAHLSEAHNILLNRRDFNDPPDLPPFSVPEVIQEAYQEIRRKINNYISKRVATIKMHEAYVREKKNLMTSSAGFEALKTLEDSLARLCQGLLSTSWIQEDPFEMELEILSGEEKILILRKEMLTLSDYQDQLEVIQHLKSESQLARVLGDSYERFSKLQVAELFTKAVSEKQWAFDNLKSKKEELTRIMLSITLNWRTKMGIADDVIPRVIPARDPHREDRLHHWQINSIFVDLNVALNTGNYYDRKFLPVFKDAIEELQIMELKMYDFADSKEYPFENVDGITSNDALTYKWACLNFYRIRNDIVHRFHELSTSYKLRSFPRIEYFSHLEDVIAKLSNKTLAREKLLKGVPKFNETIVSEKMSNIKRICGIMYNKLQSSKSKAFLHDNFERFIYQNDSFKDSFYVWKNEFHNKEISDLLSGKEVRLTSVVGPQGLNALKFRIIGIEVRSENETIQTEVEKVLKNFNVTLIHHGDSHYKCDDNVYVIKSDASSFKYKYKDLKNIFEDNYTHEFLLSPYATYSLKFEDDKNTPRHSLDDFGSWEHFKGLIDLHLTGRGIFLKKNSKIKCESNIGQFYRKEGDLEEPKIVRDFEAIV